MMLSDGVTYLDSGVFICAFQESRESAALKFPIYVNESLVYSYVKVGVEKLNINDSLAAGRGGGMFLYKAGQCGEC